MLLKGYTRAFAFRRHIAGRLLGVSFMTSATKAGRRARMGLLRKAELERHLAHYTALPVDRELCRGWAEISFNAKKQGKPIQAADAWIAASALSVGFLITNNGNDYSTVRGLTVLTA